MQVAVITLASVLLSSNIVRSDQGAVTNQKPDDWVVLSESGPNEIQRTCANHSLHDWFVGTGGGGVYIVPLANRTPFKNAIPIDLLERSNVAARDVSSVVDIRGGWLVGVDAGEWGGALWLVRRAGKNEKLIADNVRQIVRASGEAFVLTGLAHGEESRGAIQRVECRERDCRIMPVRNLEAAPEAAVAEPAGSILVLTTEALMRLRPDGQMEKLRNVHYDGLYPNSMALGKGGEIYIGMRHFVVRLVPTGGGMREEWLEPNDCSILSTLDAGCACGGSD